MDQRDLRVFLHLSDSLHFGRTSEECFLSASSLTRLVQRMEAEAGAALLERDNRSVRLTAAGQSFRAYASESIARWEELQLQLQRQSGVLAGKISLFCSVTASYSFLRELLDKFRARYPEVEIKLHTGDTAMTIQRILDQREDIGIAAKPDKLPGKLQFKPLWESPLVFIAPSVDCPLSRQLRSHRESGSDLPWQEVPMIVSETGLARERIDGWFREQGIKPDIYAQVTGNEAIVSMVSLGFGVGVVPELVVENSPKQAKVQRLRVSRELEPFSIGICALKRKLSSPLVQAFWDLSN